MIDGLIDHHEIYYHDPTPDGQHRIESYDNDFVEYINNLDSDDIEKTNSNTWFVNDRIMVMMKLKWGEPTPNGYYEEFEEVQS